ncbi:hypothetical protein ABZ599_32045 [Streptomyces misionensis]|uniref:hypothetical protein n=1 Tax=Streptomyces misionensis TaxID=67331 RepID=UPI0033BFDEE8
MRGPLGRDEGVGQVDLMVSQADRKRIAHEPGLGTHGGTGAGRPGTDKVITWDAVSLLR